MIIEINGQLEATLQEEAAQIGKLAEEVVVVTIRRLGRARWRGTPPQER